MRLASSEYSLAKFYGSLAKEWHPTKNRQLSPHDVAPGTHRRVWWKCAKGHEWLTSVANRSRRGSRCPYCVGKGGHVHRFRSYEDAKMFVSKLGLRNEKDWYDYARSGKKPVNIPASPRASYKKEWKGMGDWLGTGRQATQDRKYWTFQKAREYVRALGLKSRTEWRLYAKSDRKPADIPATPEKPYKVHWKGIGNWLGTGTLGPRLIVYRSCEEARDFIRSLGLKNYSEWQEFCKSGRKPFDIPESPGSIYQKGWRGWGDWLGTGTIANTQKRFRSFRSARTLVRSLGLKSEYEWNRYAKSDRKPSDIPLSPNVTYESEWMSIGDWLGWGSVQTQKRQDMPLRMLEASKKSPNSRPVIRPRGVIERLDDIFRL